MFIIDTNILMRDYKNLEALEDDVVIPITVIRELDNHKNDSGGNGFNARRSLRLINDAYDNDGIMSNGYKLIIDSDNPLFFLFIPLDENNAFTDKWFENAIWRNEFRDNGAVVIDQMQEGSYAVLGYIESNGIEGPNMYEVYAFYYMRDFVSSVHNPDYIWVDSSIEGWIPTFDFDDTYQMDGFSVISPRQNDTVYGGDGGYMQVVGLLFDQTIRTVEFYVDGTPQGKFNADLVHTLKRFYNSDGNYDLLDYSRK